MGTVTKPHPVNPVRRLALFRNQKFLTRLGRFFKPLPSHLFRELFSFPALWSEPSNGVKLIAGIITSSEDIFLKTEEALRGAFGPPDYRSQAIRFDFTSYYEKDMGPDLKRRFISFERFINPTALSRIKLITNRLEKRLSKDISPVRNIVSEGDKEISSGVRTVKRAVNIDPGYITDAKLVLASTKDYSHRIYLDKGIYAETALYYKKGSFRYWDWAYPDYKTDKYIRIFNEIRGIYMRQNRERCC